jgi:hypothetical protein
MTNRKMRTTGNDEMGADRTVRRVFRPTVYAAGHAMTHSLGADRLLEFLISSSYEFC